MHEAVAAMLERYACRTSADHTNALREILQEIVLLGLWRSKFFENAAFYGGTALRILHGLDRYSEDMDFTLLRRLPDFDLGDFGRALEQEVEGFGFRVEFQRKEKVRRGAVQSAFLKADTVRELLVITAVEDIAAQVPRGSVLEIRLEVDTDPPGGFRTEPRFLLRPLPFAVRTLTLPSLFAGKMHAVLCRGWRNRVKGRDWHDLVWYVARDVPLNLAHLEARMKQSGHLAPEASLGLDLFGTLLAARIEALNVDQARADVAPFLKDGRALEIWSREFFRAVGSRIVAAPPEKKKK